MPLFPDFLEEPLNMVGALVAHQALSERRNIVTEIISGDADSTTRLIEALRAIGYETNLAWVKCCDTAEAIRRNANRGDDSISAYYAERFQRACLLEACNKLEKGSFTPTTR